MSEHTTEDTINRLKALTEKLCLVQDRITIDHAVIEIETAIAELEAARVDQRLIEELWQRRTDASEANARIQQLLGDTEQLKLTVARLTEDLRRMDAITNILYVSIEKRKLRERLEV